MKKQLIIGVIIGLVILTLSIINGLNRYEKNKNIETTNITTTQTTTTSETQVTTQVETQNTTKVRTTHKKTAKRTVEDGTYKVTHYGPDCRGCSGITASGYNVKKTIWYNDQEYGNIRVVATSKKFPLYSVIRLNNYRGDNIIAIVLDRGVSGNVIDVLVSSEKEATKLGIQKNVKVDILRSGK